MSRIVIYSTTICPYCMAAKNLLKQKGFDYQEFLIDRDPTRRDEMLSRSGRRTVPQIFVDDSHVGGYDDLVRWDRDGRLSTAMGADS